MIAFAALPPYFERSRELTAILQDAQVRQRLSNQPIDGLELTAPDTYRVRAGHCEVTVTVLDDATPVQTDPSGAPRPIIVGPRRFALRVGDAQCDRLGSPARP